MTLRPICMALVALFAGTPAVAGLCTNQPVPECNFWNCVGDLEGHAERTCWKLDLSAKEPCVYKPYTKRTILEGCKRKLFDPERHRNLKIEPK